MAVTAHKRNKKKKKKVTTNLMAETAGNVNNTAKGDFKYLPPGRFKDNRIALTSTTFKEE